MTHRICSIDGCTNPHVARGWCKRHYYCWKRNGDPEGWLRFSDPAESFRARVQWQGECLVWTGSKYSSGHGSIRVDGVVVGAHRFAWQQAHGPIPDGKVIDHACHNPPCVNVEHLRLATIGENNSHLSGVQVNNSHSRVRNVYKVKAGYYVRVRKEGEARYYGLFDTVEEAAPVAERARREVFGDFAGNG